MKRTVLIVLAIACTATSALAQNPVSDSVRSSWDSVKRNIQQSAELMPEENYSFKPTADVRSFGEILSHVAGASFVFCASARNEKSPFEEDAFEKTAKTKAQIVKATADAITYCDSAFAALTDATAGAKVRAAFGTSQVTRVSSLIGQVGHDNEHYGNLVTYFRLKNLVPPSSRQR